MVLPEELFKDRVISGIQFGKESELVYRKWHIWREQSSFVDEQAICED